ncbi:MAG: diguanylate cyclase [Candidatus Omnitrophica bacterium]|nr:diguanylate cyclase [Candidatus Omnitrophota bacterium]
MEKQDITKDIATNKLIFFAEQASRFQAAQTESRHLREYLVRAGECLLGFGPVADENISRLVALYGEFMGATCALYNRLEREMLCSVGQWQVPADFKPVDKPQGHICYDVIRLKSDDPFIVRDLQDSIYAKTDPNVKQYKLQTYIGLAIKFGPAYIGSLCVVFQKDFIPSEEDIRFMRIIASAIAVEENHRQMQLKLQESNERDKLISETVKDYVFTVRIHDGKPQETSHGPTCIAVTGYSPKEFTDDPDLWIKMVHEDDRELVRKHASLILSGQRVRPIEHRIIRKDAAVRWVRNTTVLHLGKDESLLSYTGLIQDITENKNKEDLLYTSEEKYRALVETLPASTYIASLDEDSATIYVSPQINSILSFSPQEIIEDFGFWHKHIHPDDRQRVQKELNYSHVTGNPFHSEYRMLDHEGNIVWIYDTATVMRDISGNPLCMHGVMFDITERKRIEDELSKRQQEFQVILDSVPAMIFYKDRENRMIRINKTFAEAMGLSKEQIEGKTCFDLWPQQAERYWCDDKGVIESCQPKTGIIEPLMTAKGQIWIQTDKVPYRNEEGNIVGVIGFALDITERKNAEGKLESLNKELIRTNKRLSQLTLRDPHTGLYNHRFMQDIIEAEFYRAKRYGHPFSVMMIDVDYFKSINDVYGHSFGDLVLKQLARQLKMMVRQYDIVVRFGGEEFMIISPGIDRLQSLKLAQRLLDAINLYNFGDKNHTVKLKLSIAVVSYPEDKIIKGMDLVETADQILNKVKEFGGNNVYSSLDTKKKTSSRKPKIDITVLKDRIEKLTKRTHQSLVEAVFAFAKTIELKDQYTGEHVEKTVQYATEIARALKLPDEEIDRIKQAAILHDLGKIGIPERILVKKSKLTREEFEEIKKHPQIGVDILRPIKLLHNIIPIVLYHHERWDGRGYPNGLKGEEIPIGARVVAIADVYQALTSNRPYRKSYLEEKALKIIESGSGAQFDPAVVAKFVQIIRQKKKDKIADK